MQHSIKAVPNRPEIPFRCWRSVKKSTYNTRKTTRYPRRVQAELLERLDELQFIDMSHMGDVQDAQRRPCI